MMLTDLADVLRSAGLTVVEQGGWKSRSNDGNRFAGVQGILCHWTGTALSAPGSYPSLNIVTYGRSDLPGMLSQLGLGRDGIWYVIGAGVAWHAGEVDQSYSDNYHAIGIEAEYHPAQGAWPEVQQRSYERGCKALAAHYGVPLERIRGHYEAAIPYGRKPDPNTLPGGMPGFRQRVAAVNLEEDCMLFDEPTKTAYDQTHYEVKDLHRVLVGTDDGSGLPLIQRHINFVVDELDRRTAARLADAIADVDEEALADALAARGIGGASVAEVKAALAQVLGSTKLTPGA